MYYPWELYAATFVQLLPVVGGLLQGGNLPPARRWFMLWCLLSFIADGVQFIFGQVVGNNLWLRMIIAPVQVAVAFWALSLWQLDAKPRRVMRQAIFFLIPATIVIAMLWEGPVSFGDKSGPMLQLALLAGCVYTLVSRSVASTVRLAREDWFWITLGLSLYFALGVALGPVAMALLQGNTEFLKQVLLFKARADILAFVLMTIGMLCPLPRSLSLKPT
ncbi:MAG TPA: hypothetical protein VH762_00845 [Gemmatimonadaceae bacterium]